jgi:hypothetical protein
MAPLASLCSSKTTFSLTQECQEAFNKIKAAVSLQVTLVYPQYSKPFHIHTGESKFQLGRVISQENKPLAFYSSKLNQAQLNYTTIEQELLSIVESLQEYWDILLGHNLVIFTDHKNISFMIEEFGPRIQYIKGSQNIVADSLSRLPCSQACSADIWMTLPLEAKKWLLNEIKRQQQEDEKMKKSLALSKSTAVPNDKDTNNSNMPNQYAKVKNVAKGEDVIKENTGQTYAFVDEFLDEGMKKSSIYETDEDVDVDHEYWSSNHNAHATINISNSLHEKCMNLLHLSEIYHISILDGGADTCVLEQGWDVLSVHNTRRANVVGFDHEAAVKRNLPIVSAITAVDISDGISVILIIYEAIYNDTANHSLLSELQLRDFGVKIDSIAEQSPYLNSRKTTSLALKPKMDPGKSLWHSCFLFEEINALKRQL